MTSNRLLEGQIATAIGPTVYPQAKKDDFGQFAVKLIDGGNPAEVALDGRLSSEHPWVQLASFIENGGTPSGATQFAVNNVGGGIAQVTLMPEMRARLVTLTETTSGSPAASVSQVSGSGPNSGDRFTLNDGLHTPVVFEFYANGGSPPASIPTDKTVYIEIGSDNTFTNTNMLNAINGVSADRLSLTATINTTVRLNITNDYDGTIGNTGPVPEDSSGLAFGDFAGGTGNTARCDAWVLE